MFVYIVFALGKLPHPVKSRVALGLCGIVIVAMSAAGAIGVVSYFGACCGEIVCCAVPLHCVPHQPTRPGCVVCRDVGAFACASPA